MYITGSEIDRIKSEDAKEMPLLMKTIRGRLVPANTEDAEKLRWNLHRLNEAFIENKMRELTLWNCSWRENRIVFGSIAPAYDGPNIAPKFVDALSKVMQTEAAKDLKLSGYFTLIIETGQEPVVVRVIVTGGEVSYEKSEYVWAEPVTV